MPLQYKIDVLSALKDAGYSTYQIRKQSLLSQSTIYKLHNNRGVGWDNIETICRLLGCQPGDIIQYVPDEQNPAGS